MRLPIALFVLALAALHPLPVPAQTTLSAPYVAGCPAPLPPTWPASTCKYQFYPLTDTTHAIASLSKATPVYQHTYAAYASTPAVLLVACPAGAVVSADSKTCTSAGLDASALVAYSAVSKFAILPVDTPPRDYPVSWQLSVDGYLVQHSSDGGATYDAGVQVPPAATSYTFPKLPTNVKHCFQVTVLSQAYGNSSPSVICVPPQKPDANPAPPGVSVK